MVALTAMIRVNPATVASSETHVASSGPRRRPIAEIIVTCVASPIPINKANAIYPMVNTPDSLLEAVGTLPLDSRHRRRRLGFALRRERLAAGKGRIDAALW